MADKAHYKASYVGRWLKDLSNYSRQNAVLEFFKNKKLNLKQVATGVKKKFKMSFKSKFKSRQQTIPLRIHRITNFKDANGHMRKIIQIRHPVSYGHLASAYQKTQRVFTFVPNLRESTKGIIPQQIVATLK